MTTGEHKKSEKQQMPAAATATASTQALIMDAFCAGLELRSHYDTLFHASSAVPISTGSRTNIAAERIGDETRGLSQSTAGAFELESVRNRAFAPLSVETSLTPDIASLVRFPAHVSRLPLSLTSLSLSSSSSSSSSPSCNDSCRTLLPSLPTCAALVDAPCPLQSVSEEGTNFEAVSPWKCSHTSCANYPQLDRVLDAHGLLCASAILPPITDFVSSPPTMYY
mmetsp:Transcript_19255/g.48930  ORF Transcript_19255/g.48930 Transcript_19255/m.48930 type:complete len:224 (+) Transcript_19255:159-830(+)